MSETLHFSIGISTSLSSSRCIIRRIRKPFSYYKRQHFVRYSDSPKQFNHLYRHALELFLERLGHEGFKVRIMWESASTEKQSPFYESIFGVRFAVICAALQAFVQHICKKLLCLGIRNGIACATIELEGHKRLAGAAVQRRLIESKFITPQFFLILSLTLFEIALSGPTLILLFCKT